MKRILSIVSVLWFAITAQAQKEANNWAFGRGAGLTWNTTRDLTLNEINGGTSSATLLGLPTQLVTLMNTSEGCFSISDKDGNLLCYSDGITVFNKNNQAMKTTAGGAVALSGNASSAQSGIVVPYPGNPNKFLAVYLGLVGSKPGYAVIDMTGNGGLGTITTGVSLNGMSGVSGESITAIPHSNGTDYWIVCVGRGPTTYFNAWLLTSAGVAATPVISSTTIATVTGAGKVGGYIKADSSAKYFAYAPAESFFLYGNFDAEQGKFNNVRKVVANSNTDATYGIEFAASGKYLYLTNVGSNSLKAYDFNTLLATPADITDLTTGLITTKKLNLQSAIQLGPDNRLYMMGLQTYNDGSMYIVDNPEDGYNLKMYTTGNNFIKPSNSIGLPSFTPNWFAVKPKATSFACTGYDYKFTASVSSVGANAPVKLKWAFGDGNTTEQTIISGQNDYKMSHTYATPGTYTVTITPVSPLGADLVATQAAAVAVDCTIRSNRMIRVDVRNDNTLPVTKQ